VTWSGLNLLALDLTLNPGSGGGTKWGQGGSAALNVQLGKILQNKSYGASMI